MSLIKVQNFTYNIDGSSFVLTIQIPKGTTLDEFYVSTQKDVIANGSVKGGKDLLETCSFDKLFKYIETDNTEKDKPYDVYEMDWTRTPNISLGDLIFIYLGLNTTNISKDFVIPTTCGEDSTTAVFTLFDLMERKLGILNLSKKLIDKCEVPNVLIDNILRLKLLELSLELCDWCKAAEYWKLLNETKTIKHEGCGCK